MRQHRPTTNEAITDVKSLIVFETPENSDRQTITRNRSYSGYKLDTALLQQTGQAKYLLAAKHHVPQQYKPQRAERNTNLTVEGIKKKYGFSSSTKPATMNSSPLQNVANRQKPSLENYRPAVNDLKHKYESKLQASFGGLTSNYQRESENESMVLQKYRADSKQKPEREIFKETHRFSSAAPPQITADLTHKRLPSSCADEVTPNFSDQLKDRNHDWLSNLNRVQDRIRAVLQR